MPSHRRSAAPSRSAWSTATRRSRPPRPTFTTHDATQLVVAVVAEHPERIVGNLDLLPNQNQVAPAIVTLTPDDLPERVEAWAAIDRIVWQDVDSERLSTPQRDALRGWIAGGGRLVIAGGTAGPKTLSAFPDSLLPYRPVVTTDVPAASLSGILGQIPPDATALPALSGSMIGGRTLAAVGDQVVAAERPYGSGSVTLIGFDPTVDWIAKTDTSGSLWRRLLPARTSGGLTFSDDSMLVNAVSQLPTLALPPITGLLALLVAYIVLIGPINYLVLKRLDRREWAWVTMPILIVVFAAGAYAYGAVLRGSDVIVNEIAIVRGAPGATEGSAQAYLGVFSPIAQRLPGQRPGGRAPVDIDQRRHVRRRRHRQPSSTSSRAIRRGCATWPSGSGRCGRSGPRRRSPSRSSRRTCVSRTAA